MELFLTKYINKMLKKANYEYDSTTNSWCASVDELPGVYAQADSIEDARSELAEIIEEYVFVSLQEGHPLPEFRNFRISLRMNKKTSVLSVSRMSEANGRVYST